MVGRVTCMACCFFLLLLLLGSALLPGEGVNEALLWLPL